jgi:hypothetical protein
MTPTPNPADAFTPYPAITNSLGSSACAPLYDRYLACSSLNAGWSTVTDFNSAAECYCYASSGWDPSRYDPLYAQCWLYYATAGNAPIYLTAGGGTGGTAPCASVGDVKATRGTATHATMAPAVTNPPDAALACARISAGMKFCESLYPGWRSLYREDPLRAATCLCYFLGSWRPWEGDGDMRSCVGYLRSVDPGGPGEGMEMAQCGILGDLRAWSTDRVTTGSEGSVDGALSTDAGEVCDDMDSLVKQDFWN